MQGSKIIFLDVDGTMVNFNAELPETTAKALRLAKENGHKLIVCTGRGKGQLQKCLEDIEFDGYVCAAGGYVEYANEIISRRFLSQENYERAARLVLDNDIPYLIQLGDYIATVPDMVDRIADIFVNNLNVSVKSKDRFLSRIRTFDDIESLKNVEKVLYYGSKMPIKDMREHLGDELYIVDMSFIEGGDDCGEICQAGINKSSGMKILLDSIGRDISDVIAIGDGENDIDMLEFAPVGIAMGNAKDEVKAHANMVTTHIDDDGIYNVFKELDLI